MSWVWLMFQGTAQFLNVFFEGERSVAYLLSTEVRGHAVQVQVVSQLFDFEFHQLGALQEVAVETPAGVTQAGAGLRLSRAAAAVVLFAVGAHVLGGGGGGGAESARG